MTIRSCGCADMGQAAVEAYIAGQQRKGLLRFITCGSVDDGKSTLIGRLLWESRVLFEDQLAALEADSKRLGTQGGEIDLALLVDGLQAEREQKITIDVAYRFFATERRKFIVADTPGHEQYTRNMATGASTAELAVILIDARKGVLEQTRRHSYIVSLLGIRHVLLAVNKMDLIGYAEEAFARIVADYRKFAAQLDLPEIVAIPVSALKGDNVTELSANMPWYDGPTLLDHLETVEIATPAQGRLFRMPVQWVNRPNLDFRGFSGMIAAGTVAPGDRIRVLPSGKDSTVRRIVTYDGDLETAVAGQSVTLTLADEIDISRGDVLAAADAPPAVADQFHSTLVWMGEEPLLPGRSYLLKLGTKLVTASVSSIRHKINVNTLEHLAAKTLALNEIGVCHIGLDQPIAFEPYAENRDLGGYILIDRLSNNTVGAGLLDFALRRSQNVQWQALDIDKAARSRLKGQTACVLWFTGLSGAGKSTIANLVERKLFARGRHTVLLDGDNIRHGLNKDLGFTDADRVENIRRVGEVAKLMVDAGLVVLTAFISPFRSERRMARELMGPGEFIEIFVDTPLEVAEARDPKGLYRRARRGEIKNFTGIDSPYEPPEDPDIRVNTATGSAEEAADVILWQLEAMGMI
jgi:bifunctional enzyme CysN/CysC